MRSRAAAAIFIAGFWGGAPLQAFAMDLEQFLTQVRSQHKGIQSFEKSKEAATFRREAGDIGLSPVLSAGVKSLDDKKPQSLGTYYIERTEALEYTLGLGKKFSTGTQGSVSASLAETKVTASNLATPTVPASSSTLGTGSLGVSLSQSLWKDGFGSATSLRRERETVIESTEKQSYDLQEKQVLIDAEAAYWDYLYLQEELKQRQDSLERAKRIENWVRRRVSNGIGDSADLLNAQGLVAARELQLLVSQDEVKASEKKIRDLLEMDEKDKLPDLSGDLNLTRGLEQMSQGANRGRKIRLDSYLQVLDAKTRAIAAREVEDAYKPDLTLEGQYRTNSSESSMSAAQSEIANGNKPTSAVGLRLSWMLDGDLKNAAKQTARAEALAASLKKERKLLESDSSWSEMKRRHEELTKKIRAAEVANDVQNRKAAAERDKLSKGRSITSQVITAEQDAAEAQLTLNKLKVEQRKLEAQGRLFVTVEE